MLTAAGQVASPLRVAFETPASLTRGEFLIPDTLPGRPTSVWGVLEERNSLLTGWCRAGCIGLWGSEPCTQKPRGGGEARRPGPVAGQAPLPLPWSPACCTLTSPVCKAGPVTPAVHTAWGRLSESLTGHYSPEGLGTGRRPHGERRDSAQCARPHLAASRPRAGHHSHAGRTWRERQGAEPAGKWGPSVSLCLPVTHPTPRGPPGALSSGPSTPGPFCYPVSPQCPPNVTPTSPDRCVHSDRRLKAGGTGCCLGQWRPDTRDTSVRPDEPSRPEKPPVWAVDQPPH